MVDKLISKGNITEVEDKILTRLKRGRLQFGNRLQLAEIKILTLINDLKFNEDFFKECEGCQDKISITGLTMVDNSLYCENCISEKFYSCENCGDLIYNEDIHTIDSKGYCQECYFKVKQKIYHTHKIITPLIKKLGDIIIDYDIFTIEFKIDKHLYSIECYSNGSYRLGSWGANSWVDIGNSKDDLLRAIDYNLGVDNKLTNIFLNDDIEVEL